MNETNMENNTMPSPLKKSFAAELLKKRQKKGMSPKAVILLMVAVIAVVVGGYALYSRYIALPGKAEITSIAVLPLDNISGDPEQVYFSDGMHEALISNLSKIGALRVISRTSVMQFRDTEKTIPEIARELNVDALIEGSVFRTDNKVLITVQLIAAEPEQHLWANEYERELREVISLHREVARAIADEIEIAVTSEEKESLSSARTVNPEAYDLYLMGRHFTRRYETRKSLDYFLQAVEKDSSFAAAYAEIAFLRAWTERGSEAPLKAYTEAKKALERAFELDDTLPGAYHAKAMISFYYEWDWRTAEDNFKKAIEIDPSYMTTYTEIDNLLILLGKEQEALELQRKALKIDPFSLEVMQDNMAMLGYLGDYEEAEQLYKKLVEIDSTRILTYRTAGFVYAAQGKYDEAIAAFTKDYQLRGYSRPNIYTGYVYALMGKRAEAEKILDDYQAEYPRAEYPRAVWYANIVRLGLKDYDPIFEMLENQYNERFPQLLINLLQYKRWSKDIVADPRWKALMKKMGLPE